jgi:PIN domain nuclease of toxin-antitoxin system
VRLLLDTHIVLWQLAGTRTLALPAQAAIENADELLFSVVSFAEIGIKAAVGKLDVPADFRERVRDIGIGILRLEAEHGLSVARLPVHHRDPCDRLLIAQARAEDLTVVTADPRFAAYGVAVVQA